MPIIGTVKWFDTKKGFGFIIGPGGKDVFVHFTRIEGNGFRSLRDGEQVEYEHTQGEKGLLATMVRRPVSAVMDPASAAAAALFAPKQSTSDVSAHAAS